MGSGSSPQRPVHDRAPHVFEKEHPSPYRNKSHPGERASQADHPACSSRVTTIANAHRLPPDSDSPWQRKNQKTYAPIGCEQVVGKFALKWFFGSQLLRPRPDHSRRRVVLSHVTSARLSPVRRNASYYP